MADTKLCCANETCFACRYWEERVRWAENDGMMPASGSEPAGRIARVDGQHYVFQPFNTTRQSQWLGHRGQVFTFRFTDGRQYTSNDVWCQGEIPAHFWDRLPDNAVIVPQDVPSPNSCRHCGVDEREHMQRWKPTAGWHTWTPPTQDQILAHMRARRAAPEGELTMPDTLAHGVTVDCFDVQLDNGENLKALGVGNHLELNEPAAGMQVGLWQVVAYHGEFQDRATMRPVSSTEWAELRRAEAEKFDAIWAPTAPVKEV